MLRRRAPRACTICRNRKVRCDVSRKGTPCSNCSRASVVCSVDNAWKEKPMQHPGKKSLPPANVYTFKLGAPAAYDTADHETVSAEATAGGQVPPGRLLNDATPVEWRRGGEIADTSLSLDQPELPSYIARLPGGLDRDVLQLLLRRGALTIPSKPMIDELLRVFLSAIDGTNSDSISVVLFQAVMFAGVTFADLPHLQREGFQSYSDARKVFFNRVEAISMGQLCAQKVKLCLIIGRILDSQYELSGVRLVDSSDPFMVLIPKMKVLSTEAAARDHELREWSAETASIREAALGQDHRRNGRVLGLHSATLELLYLTALCAVHRPLLLHEQPKDSAAEALQSFSRSSLRSSARRISEIARHLEESHLIQFLPPLAVGAFIVASIQHLKDALSAEAELRATGNLYLRQTLQAFAALRPKYNSADCAIAFIERVRSGQLPYRTFEWEDRANSQAPYDEHMMIRADGEPDTITIAQIGVDSTPQPFVTQNPNVRLLKDGRHHPTDMSGNSFGNDEDINIPYFRSSNLEAISDLLLSAPFDANNIDWAKMDWHYVDNIET
ncbi:uncharacterized protein Z519_04221 [Cladophialophora bantiana CBS 173.52]|uniref:Zn(2)-C6 fungal-type domain-containing protein n=1 Tax=Cladophialophora bantiana (strain ATCC 10958 / CBS 173.52 / CDC B-1940 / NIH 8579) TaxID=1442370 RepID=A0A0D2F0B4_CLAB1|nr:uncharacterized protein Z519_04221 [Cladophialophora bantiana CBS 173.52]KIW95636.1 hypothetical protein Z519_04221 [Cladophialophora bantiana CBS 173.52]